MGQKTRRAFGPKVLTGLWVGATLSASLVAGLASAQPGGLPPIPNAIHAANGSNPSGSWKGKSITLPHSRYDLTLLSAAAATGQTVPFWTATVTSPVDKISYSMSMVGSSPFAAKPAATTITYVPIVLRLHVSNGSTVAVLDPTKPACGDTVPIATRFFNSPLFQKVTYISNGQNITEGVGGAQLVSAFQRANFWSYVKSTQYGVNLAPSTATPIVVDANVTGALYTIGCKTGKTATLAAIDINTFDAVMQSLTYKYATASQLPTILTYNAVQTESGGCCILGYHNAMMTPKGVQTYAVGAYIDSGVFSGVDDISTWSHELAEWMDDPFVQASVPGGGNDDLTPSWGNVGQVQGCQNNLEVGDPLSGTEFAITGTGGFVYHYQDLAFHDWFYRTPSKGSGGKYSFAGTFTSSQSKVC